MVVIIFSAFSALDYTDELIAGELEKITSEAQILSNSYLALYELSDDLKNAALLLDNHMQATNAAIFLFDIDGTAIDKPDLSKARLNKAAEPVSAQTRLINKLFTKSNTIPIFNIPPEINSINDLPFNFNLQSQMPDLRLFRSSKKKMEVAVFRPLITSAGAYIGNMVILYDEISAEKMLMTLRANMINTILVSLLFITLLSLFLAAYIGHPLRRLAMAAEAIRQGEGTYQDIPDFSNRGDEISVLSETLQAMTSELVQRLDSIDSFAADVAHELKNPLTSLRSAIETSAIVKDKKKQEKLLSIMLHDLDRMDRLITDISKASRLDTELARERLEPIDITQVLRDAVDYIEQFLERNSDKKYANIVLTKPSQAPDTGTSDQLSAVLVKGSTIRLLQVFENILSNALSFAPANSAIEIGVNIWASPHCVEITFRDHGQGISGANLERIFERFYTERREQTTFGMHSGLGLSICRQIIHAHGGKIKADNHPAGGAQFTVILPVYEES
tara:strand:+ start:251769 stop:253283 length:1515 start_codon:yes stop_codon:yes gene_type:complete